MKRSLSISNFLEEISSLSHSVVFLYFFALIAEEGFLISSCYSLELCIQMLQFSSVQSLSVWLFATPWIAARQASLSITISWSSFKLTCIESVMPSSLLILCRPLLLLPPIPPSIRVFSNESTLRIRWPKYWSFLPKNTQGWSPLGWTGWISLQSKGLSRVFSYATI